VVIEVISLEVVGLVGALLGESRVSSWSVASIAASISGVTQLADPVWLAVVQGGFYFTIVAMPFVWMLSALALWMVPLRPLAMHRLLVVVEAANAWAMLDVFVVIMLTSLLSIDQFAQYTLSDDPNIVQLNDALAKYPELGSLLPGEPVALGVIPTLKPEYWILFCGTLAAVPLGLFVTHAANHVYEQQQRNRVATTAPVSCTGGATDAVPPARAPEPKGHLNVDVHV